MIQNLYKGVVHHLILWLHFELALPRAFDRGRHLYLLVVCCEVDGVQTAYAEAEKLHKYTKPIYNFSITYTKRKI